MSRQFKTKYTPELAIEGAAIAGGLWLAEHIGLYRWRGRLSLPLRYGVGVLTGLIGFAHVCAERDDLEPLADIAIIFAAGLVVVGGGHSVRWLSFVMKERARGPVPDYARIGGA